MKNIALQKNRFLKEINFQALFCLLLLECGSGKKKLYAGRRLFQYNEDDFFLITVRFLSSI